MVLFARYTFIKAQDKCSCCGFPLMTQAFYAFPCSHKFHSKCLTEEVGTRSSSCSAHCSCLSHPSCCHYNDSAVVVTLNVGRCFHCLVCPAGVCTVNSLLFSLVQFLTIFV